MLLKVSANTCNVLLYLSIMKEHDVAILHDLRVFSRLLLLAIFENAMKVFKCFTTLNRLLCSSPLSGTLNFSLWIAEVLALEQEVLSVATR